VIECTGTLQAAWQYSSEGACCWWFVHSLCSASGAPPVVTWMGAGLHAAAGLHFQLDCISFNFTDIKLLVHS
jgi:hypothetical protein